MRLKTIDAFEKHLVQSAPEHRSSIYLLLIEDAFERKYYAGKIYRFLQREEKTLTLERGMEALSHLFASSHRLVLIDPCEDMASLLKEISYISPGTKIVLGRSSLDKELCHAWEKVAVVLDLLDEKPWERKERFQEEAVKLVKREKKSITPEAIAVLMEAVSSFAFIKSEIDKLLCYVGDKKEISLADVKAIACREGEESFWEIAEALVLGKDTKAPSCKDISSFLNLLWQIRYYTNLALQWKVEKSPPKELKGARLERFRKRVDAVPLSHFMRLEDLLFVLETKGKTAVRDSHSLWEELLIGIASLT